MAHWMEELTYRILPRVRPGRALADSEWRTLVDTAEVVLDGSPVPLSPEDVADNVERFLCLGRSRHAYRVRLLLTLIEAAPLPRHGRPWSRLSRAERAAVVEQRWMGGRGLGALCAKVRYLVLMGAYGDARAHGATGYVPAPRRERLRVVASGRSRPVGLSVSS